MMMHTLTAVMCVLGMLGLVESLVERSVMEGLSEFMNSVRGTLPGSTFSNAYKTSKAIKGWNFTQVNGSYVYDPCRDGWTLMACTDSRITRLELRGVMVNGSLPSTINQLKDLEYFALNGANVPGRSLRGVIPTTIGLLRNLSNLQLVSLDCKGTLPTELGLLTRLTMLQLNYLKLVTGTLPSTLANLAPNLKKLILMGDRGLDSNPFPGNLVTQLTNLDVLHLSGLNMYGPLPDFSGLRLLASLELSGYGNTDTTAQLTGTIPASLGSSLSLSRLNLWTNALTGTIPSTLANLMAINFFDLSNNRIEGTFPSWLANLNPDKITYLSVTGNSLSGQLPDKWPILQGPSMIGLLVDHNKFTGTVPNDFCLHYASLWTFYADYNDYTCYPATDCFKDLPIGVVNDLLSPNNGRAVPPPMCHNVTGRNGANVTETEIACAMIDLKFEPMAKQPTTQAGYASVRVFKFDKDCTLSVQEQQQLEAIPAGTQTRDSGYIMRNTERYGVCLLLVDKDTGIPLNSFRRLYSFPGPCGPESYEIVLQEFSHGDLTCSDPSRSLNFTKVYRVGACAPVRRDFVLGREHDFTTGTTTGISYTFGFQAVANVSLADGNFVRGPEVWGVWPPLALKGYSENVYASVLPVPATATAAAAVSSVGPSMAPTSQPSLAVPLARAQDPGQCQVSELWTRRAFRLGTCVGFSVRPRGGNGAMDYHAYRAFKMGCSAGTPGSKGGVLKYSLFEEGPDVYHAFNCCEGEFTAVEKLCRSAAFTEQLDCSFKRRYDQTPTDQSAFRFFEGDLEGSLTWFGTTDDANPKLSSNTSALVFVESTCTAPPATELAAGSLRLTVFPAPSDSDEMAGAGAGAGAGAAFPPPRCGDVGNQHSTSGPPIVQQTMRLNVCTLLLVAPGDAAASTVPVWVRRVLQYPSLQGDGHFDLLLYTYDTPTCRESKFNSHLSARYTFALLPSSSSSSAKSGGMPSSPQCLRGSDVALLALFDPEVVDIGSSAFPVNIALEYFASSESAPSAASPLPPLNLDGYQQSVYSSHGDCSSVEDAQNSRHSTFQDRVFSPGACIPTLSLSSSNSLLSAGVTYKCKYGLKKLEDLWTTSEGSVAAFASPGCAGQPWRSHEFSLPRICKSESSPFMLRRPIFYGNPATLDSVTTAPFSVTSFCTAVQPASFLQQVEDEYNLWLISTVFAALSLAASLFTVALILDMRKTRWTVYNKLVFLLALAQFCYDASFFQAKPEFSTTKAPDSEAAGFANRSALLMRIFGVLTCLLTNVVSLAVCYVVLYLEVFPLSKYLSSFVLGALCLSSGPSAIMFAYEMNEFRRGPVDTQPGSPSLWALNLYILRGLIIVSIVFNLGVFFLVAKAIVKLRKRTELSRKGKGHIKKPTGKAGAQPVAREDAMLELTRRLLVFPLVQTVTQLPVLYGTFSYAQKEQDRTDDAFLLTPSYRFYQYSYYSLAPTAGFFFALANLMQPGVREHVKNRWAGLKISCRRAVGGCVQWMARSTSAEETTAEIKISGSGRDSPNHAHASDLDNGGEPSQDAADTGSTSSAVGAWYSVDYQGPRETDPDSPPLSMTKSSKNRRLRQVRLSAMMSGMLAAHVADKALEPTSASANGKEGAIASAPKDGSDSSDPTMTHQSLPRWHSAADAAAETETGTLMTTQDLRLLDEEELLLLSAAAFSPKVAAANIMSALERNNVEIELPSLSAGDSHTHTRNPLSGNLSAWRENDAIPDAVMTPALPLPGQLSQARL